MGRKSPELNPPNVSAKTREEKNGSDLEQFPDFLRIKSLHIFLFGADVEQTVVTPHSDFEWLRGDVRRSWLETVAARSQTSARMSGIQLCVGTGKPATCVWLDRPGRIAGAPWSMQAVTAETEQVRAPAVEAWASQTRRVHNELTSFVLLIIICHPRKRNKGHNHGYSERARRKRRT